MKTKQAIELLNAISGDDPEADHSSAEAILLKCVHPEIRDAYESLKQRAAWWATA